MEDALVISPDKEQELFSLRDQFELIVYYDQDSRRSDYRGGPTNDSQQVALSNLLDAIYTSEIKRPLKRHPCLLVGGIEAWVEHCGLNSLVTSKTVLDIQPGIPSFRQRTETRAHTESPISKIPAYTADIPEISIEKETEWLKNLQKADYNSFSQNDHAPYLADAPTKSAIVSLNDSSTSYLLSSSLARQDPKNYRIVRNMNDYIKSVPDLGINDLTYRRPRINVDSANIYYAEKDIPAFRPAPNQHQSEPNVVASYKKNFQSVDGTATLPPSPTITRSERQHSIGNNYSGLGEVSAGTTGLKNLGNTCYMNSVLQCLAGTSSLARYFLNGSYRKDVNLQNRLGSKGLLAKSFGDLLAALYNDQCTFIVPTTMKVKKS